jgi:hypothetical protein
MVPNWCLFSMFLVLSKGMSESQTMFYWGEDWVTKSNYGQGGSPPQKALAALLLPEEQMEAAEVRGLAMNGCMEQKEYRPGLKIQVLRGSCPVC